MSNRNTALRRLAAAAGVLALAAAGTLAASTAASAAVGPDQPNAPESGTLTINKYGGLPVEQGGDLTDPLSGVEFTVNQVGRLDGGTCVALDLTDAADWDGLDGLFASQPAAPADPFCLTSVTQADVTDAGSVEFDLAVGVYYVQETDPGDNAIASPVPNFYVSIPTSGSDVAGGWEYNVVADPKNQLVDEPTKTISEQPSNWTVGSNVTWTLTVPVPDLADAEDFTSGSVTDVLDSRLEYVSSVVKIGDTTLVAGTDYTLDASGVTWTFVPAVLDGHEGQSITIELVTQVVTVGDGAIDNPGGENGYFSEFNGTTVPGGTTPYTYWGQLSILKTDDSANTLAGAEFQVFLPNDLGQCADSAPTTGSIATGTSDGVGVVQWAGATPTNVLGLWIQNSPDGALTDPSKDYCVYETVVPAGHSADLTGKLVTITAGAPVVDESALTVINPKQEGPGLPLTGGTMSIVLPIIGLALVAGGAGAILYTRRRRDVEN